MNLPRVYFYCRNEPGNLQEDIISIAEGFVELGIPFHSNCDYWLQSTRPDDYLFRCDPSVGPDDCDIVVVSYTWPYWISRTFNLVRRPLPVELFRKGRKYQNVYMDSHDGHRTVSWESEYRQFDLILRSKLNRRAWHPENMRPWALALNNRILNATSGAPPFSTRRKRLLVNFGASHPYSHGTRDLAHDYFESKIEGIFPLDQTKDNLMEEPTDPYDALMWLQTGQRFSRKYYERLKQSQAVACFCGELIPPMPFRNPERYLVGGNRAKLRRFFYEVLGRFDRRPYRSVQWDSFRFWETMAAGCVAFNVDIEYYGVDLPVMPENWKQYIGVRFNLLDQLIERLGDDPESIERISREGRRWALEHYSPHAVARRFLAALGYDVLSISSGRYKKAASTADKAN
jgi:Glycosyl transferases group 1